MRRSERRAVSDTEAPEPFPIVGIGASAGGLEAVERLLRAVPADTGLAFLLVQHLDRTHPSRLSEILARATSMPVVEARDGMQVQANHVYTIPPDRTMRVRGRRLRIEKRVNGATQFMPVDALFGSLAREEKNRAIGVILSGAASDGAAGVKEIKQEGGITFAQDYDSARYPGMPNAAVATGAVDLVMPPEDIARALARLIHDSYVRLPAELMETKAAPPTDEASLLTQLYRRLWKTFGVDFSVYKQSTIRRRIRRRLAVCGVPTLEEYLNRVSEQPDELSNLYSDMFIGVTGFFREPMTFAALRRIVFPHLLRGKRREPVRIWVPGCSTGEEVYSIAISFMEHAKRLSEGVDVQIFGTDINEEAVRRARQGQYLASIVRDVGEKRLRYFVKTEEGYQVGKTVRDRCIFARHDVLRDPPFSRLDLISCRNLLIYLGGAVQHRLIPVFHYGLNPEGFLLLGAAEHIEGSSQLFDLVDRRAKIYVKKPGLVARPHIVGGTSTPAPPVDTGRLETRGGRSDADLHRAAADHLMVSQYAPAAVLVDENMEILHFRGRTGRYLEPPSGSASLNLFGMARQGLLVGLRSALDKARASGAPAEALGLFIEGEGGDRRVDLRAVPVRAPGSDRRSYLVVFFESPGETPLAREGGPGRPSQPRAAGPSAAESQILQLKEELAASKVYLQSVIESQEAGGEELRATNEELLSTNEELKSTTEELETANEELQSANEELVTLNEELSNRNRDLGEAHDDILNLLASMRLSIAVVDRGLRIRRLTPSAESMLGLKPADVGRSIAGIRLKIELPEFERLLQAAVEEARGVEQEIQDQEGRWYSLQIQPYKTAEGVIDGAVVALGDIHGSKRVEESLRTALRHAPTVLFTQDRDLRYTWIFNPLPPWTADLVGKTDHDVFGRADAQRLAAVKKRVLNTGVGAREVVRLALPDGNAWFDLTVEPLRLGDRARHTVGLTCATWNVTAQTEALIEQRHLAVVEERQRVVGDLHDGLAQSLSAIVLRLEDAEQVLDENPREAREQISRARDLTRESLEDTRRVLQALGPRFLEANTLPEALRLLVQHIKGRNSTPVEVAVRGTRRQLAPAVEENLLRACQEALTNAFRHAHATRIVVGLAYRRREVAAWVEDDGRGFKMREAARPSGLGLAILRERARRIGAKMDLRTRRGRGTRVELTVSTPGRRTALPRGKAGPR